MQFLEGYILGLGMILFIGPVFFLLISVSLQLGTRAGILVALGIIVSDIACVYLCNYGVTAFLYESNSKFWMLLLGGILLILLGLKYLLRPSQPLELQEKLPSLHHLTCFVKGFLVNFVNPFVFFVWIGVIAYAKEKEATSNNSLIYLSGVLTAILSTDLLKVFAARQIKSFLKPETLKYLYCLSGIVLVCFGLRMILLLI